MSDGTQQRARLSAGSNMRQATGLGRNLRGALATRAPFRRAKGSGAPAHGQAGSTRPRVLLALTALAALATLILGIALASATAPVVTVEAPAAKIGFTSARARGEVNPGEKETSYHYEYVEAAKFEATAWAEATPTDTETLPAGINVQFEVEPANLTGLVSGTEYHLRLLATNEDGTEEAATTFTTQTATAPALTIEPATSVAYTTAHIQGTIDPEGGNVNPIGSTPVQIAWELQTNREGEGWNAVESGTISGAEAESNSPITVEKDLEGLQNGSHYAFRLFATYAGKEALSGEEEFTTLAVTKPSVSIESPSLVNAQKMSYFFAGHINPNGTDPAFNTEWHFDCEPGCGFVSGEPIAADESSHLVSGEAENLEPNTAYTVTLHTSNLGGETTVQATFKTPAVGPGVATGTNTPEGDEAVHLRAYVNPRNSKVTACSFEYGPTPSYGQSVPCEGDPNGPGPAGSFEGPPAEVTAHLSGLSPGTAYHWRLVATNAAGTSQSPDASLETLSAHHAPASCSNEARRSEQHSSYLPECRAFEQVSPPNKSGGDVMADSQRTRVASDGSAAAFTSLVASGGAVGGSVATEYESVRGPGGWSTHAITPPQAAETPSLLLSTLQSQYEGGFSADLSHGVFLGISPVTPEPSVANVPNIYLRDDLRTPGSGHYSLLSACPLCEETSTALPPNSEIVTGGVKPYFAGASADFEQVIFESQQRLTREAAGTPSSCSGEFSPRRCPVKLYESDHGAVRLVGLVPPGGQSECTGLVCESPAAGSRAGQGAGASQGAKELTPHTISADGSRVFFIVPSNFRSASGALYMREDHETTVQLNVSERKACLEAPGSCPSEPATYWDASVDGSRVFFTSNQALTDGAPTDGSAQLYMYDTTKPASDPHNLTLISANHASTFDQVRSVLGSSSDGHYVYFSASGQLVQGQPRPLTVGFYAWHEGTVRYIAPLEAFDTTEGTTTANWFLTRPTSRVTPDGLHLLFSSTISTGPTGYDQGNCSDTGSGSGCREFYLYSYSSQRLACATCNPSGQPASSSASIAARIGTGGATTSSAQDHPFSDDGRHLFFTTGEPLVPGDTNGAPTEDESGHKIPGTADVYEYDAESGTVHLISSGTDEANSYFMGASADGSAAFFLTAQKLTGSDTDGAYDLYDANVNGGFAEPPPAPAPCEADTCRGPAGNGPATESAASGLTSGPGNPPVNRHCHKGKVKRHGKCIASKHHRKSKNHKRANANRRVSR